MEFHIGTAEPTVSVWLSVGGHGDLILWLRGAGRLDRFVVLAHKNGKVAPRLEERFRSALTGEAVDYGPLGGEVKE